jgi:hypothetical protein
MSFMQLRELYQVHSLVCVPNSSTTDSLHVHYLYTHCQLVASGNTADALCCNMSLSLLLSAAFKCKLEVVGVMLICDGSV